MDEGGLAKTEASGDGGTRRVLFYWLFLSCHFKNPFKKKLYPLLFNHPYLLVVTLIYFAIELTYFATGHVYFASGHVYFASGHADFVTE
ncbi:MAG: hypothetical protein A2173_09270 [Planctomycetes bacterium RBG_13_44_8b]|nr:MAG: hypothetical protein A2173_09270 [Planctomycetes bacterium RBG_13_44_8b]